MELKVSGLYFHWVITCTGSLGVKSQDNLCRGQLQNCIMLSINLIACYPTVNINPWLCTIMIRNQTICIFSGEKNSIGS